MLPLTLSLVLSVGAFFAAVADILTSNPQAMGLLLGVISPLGIAVVQQTYWSKAVKQAVLVVVSLVLGVVTVAASGQFNPGDLVTTFVLVLVAAQVAYKAAWKPSGVTAKIESATTY